MLEIKPCPFCGKEADYWEDNQYTDRHVIECGNCGATKRSEYGFDSVLRDWNRRFDNKGQEIQEVTETRYRPRVVARLPNGGAVVIWNGEDTHESLEEARSAGRFVSEEVKLEYQTIEV